MEASGGPDIAAYNLSSRMQRYAQSWAIVDNLPDTPTTVLVGVNLGRFTTSPKSNYNQVIGRELLLKSDSLRRWVTARSGEHKYSYTILPGIFSALTSYLQQSENALLKGKLHPSRTRCTPSTRASPCPTRRSRTLVQKWLDTYYPAFKKVHKFDAAMLDGLIAEGKRRGLDMVIVELPWNREIIGDAFDPAIAAVPGADRRPSPRSTTCRIWTSTRSSRSPARTSSTSRTCARRGGRSGRPSSPASSRRCTTTAP